MNIEAGAQAMITFREPPIALLGWIRLSTNRTRLLISYGCSGENDLDVPDAEELLEVLLDICPNVQDKIDDYLAREGLMVVERSRP